MPTFKKMVAATMPEEEPRAEATAEPLPAEHLATETAALFSTSAPVPDDSPATGSPSSVADSLPQADPAPKDETQGSAEGSAATVSRQTNEKSEIPFAEVAEEYSGQWSDQDGKAVALIRDGKMVGALGTTVDLIIRSRGTCEFALGGQTVTGTLVGSGKIRWSHGGVWTKTVRGINKQAKIQRVQPKMAQPRPVPKKSVQEEKEEMEQSAAFEEARARSDAGIEKAKQRFEEERARKAAARERVKKAKEFEILAEPGMIVRICGLLSRAEMNGQLGEIVQWSEEKQRWQVEMDNGDGSKLFKTENLELVDWD